MTPQELQKEWERIAKSGGIVSPGPTDVHVNRPLTNISIAYSLNAMDYIADRVFPDVPVMKRSDVYYTIPRGHFLRDEMRERAPGTESAGASYTFETESYECKTYALHKNIDDETRANYDMPLTADATATRFLTEKALIHKERIFADTFMKASAWSFTATGATSSITDLSSLDFSDTDNNTVDRWSRGSSAPIDVIRQARRDVQGRTGRKPNIMVMGPYVYDALLDHDDIVGRIDRGQTSGPAVSNKEALAAILELDEILVMEGIHNSAVEGVSDSVGFIAGNSALLCYRASSPALEEPTAGYTFSWTGRVGAGNMGTRIKRMRMEEIESDRIEIQSSWVQKVVAPDLGVFFTTIA